MKTEFNMSSCPKTFPAKVAMLLFERFKHFKGSQQSGYYIIPCELIESNGNNLKKCIIKHAEDWNLGADFISWIEKSNYFCNTLVDRIVPGYPKDEITILRNQLGYEDNMLVSSEVFHLWVIEANDKIKKEFPLTEAGLNVVWTDDITPYRTLKVRILNGLHTTFTIPSLLIGNETVKQSMDDALINKMIQKALYNEIIPTLDFSESEIDKYASAVLERFRNPFIKHYLLSITLNSVSKFKVRVLPSLLKFVEKNNTLPVVTLFSLACLLRFYRFTEDSSGNTVCDYSGRQFKINDEQNVIQYFSGLTKSEDKSSKYYVRDVLSNESLWGRDLTKIKGLAEKVTRYLEMIESEKFDIVLQKILETIKI